MKEKYYRNVNNFLLLPRILKNLIVLSLDIFICFFTVWLSFYLRTGFLIDLNKSYFISAILSILIGIPVFRIFGLYKIIYRFFELSSVKRIFKSSLIYGILYSFILNFIGVSNIPRTIGLIQPILLFIFICSSRLFISGFINSFLMKQSSKKYKIKSLIYGAGIAGRQLFSALLESKEISVVGFLDDDPKLQGRIVNSLLVSNPNDLGKLIKSKNISHLLLAIPSANRSKRKEILNKIKDYQLTVRTMPSFTDLASGKVSVKELRDLEIDDLLDRDVVEPDKFLLEKNIKDKVVLVTGAGGSIGSELCRQIIQLSPKKILLVEISEYALYFLHNELEAILQKKDLIIPLLASVQDKARMNEIISTFKPDTIYHAAAYKHVPIVEQNLIEGIKNNILGTINVAQCAKRNGVKNFVLISTDKAVRPTNIMGASKRFSELCVQGLLSQNIRDNQTINSIVRFGNVLDSSGSVIPKFRAQIRNGGPITLTHKEVVRYFMTIPEAAQLVIQASAMAIGGEVFVLDMGAPVKIADLAERMIKLSGLSIKNNNNLNGDIEIKVTGLRPGEKLYEELLIGDNPENTQHPKIKKAKDPYIEWEKLVLFVNHLEKLISRNDVENIINLLKDTAKGYIPSKELVDLVFIEKNKIK